MPPWTYALLFLVAVMAVALTFDRQLARSKPTPAPVRARRRPADGEARHRAG